MKITPTCTGIQSEDLCVYFTLKVEANTFKERTSDANNTFKVRTFFYVSLNMTSINKAREMAHTSPIPLQGGCYPVHLVTKRGPGFRPMSQCPHFECGKLMLFLALNATVNACMYVAIHLYILALCKPLTLTWCICSCENLSIKINCRNLQNFLTCQLNGEFNLRWNMEVIKWGL